MDVSDLAKDSKPLSDPLCTDIMIKASEEPLEDHGKFARIKQWFQFENSNQRKNLVTNLVVYINIILLGWTYDQLTTAFPDIQLILNTNVQQTSLIFTMNAVGYMLGSLAMGYCYDEVNHLRRVDGFLCGGRGGGDDATVLSRWGTESRHLTQGTYLSYGLGGVLAPLDTRLFLAPRVPPTAINTIGQDKLGNFSLEWNTTSTPNDYRSHSNISKIPHFLSSSFGESDVRYGVMFITFCAAESKVQSFLFPFVMLQMGWSKFDGAYLLFLLWGFFTAGRSTGVVIARFLSPRKLACLCLCTLIVSYIILAVGGLLEINAIIWTIVPFIGLGLSLVFPTFVVWTHENAIEVKGKMSGFFQFVAAVGFFTDPFYIGYLMEYESPMYMLYIGIPQATCSLIIFISTTLWISSRKVKTKV
ncbi:MFS4B-like protein [Mya arenaria]|uniref:MFS4B-like protein n=1 Tax=Mya arenaria TaxID=6604 RepID=A0ABY7FGW6_MYAAR|nr:MFS4B-like protein [Mya arenaria]